MTDPCRTATSARPRAASDPPASAKHPPAGPVIIARTFDSSHPDATYPAAPTVLNQLLHDVRSPLAGIGLLSELVSSNPSAVPAGVLQTLSLHYSELIRHFSELEIFVSDALGLGHPPAHSVSLSDVLDVALVHAKPYLLRRRQCVDASGLDGHIVRFPEHYLKQILLVILYDVSMTSVEGSCLGVSSQHSGAYVHVWIGGPLAADARPERLLMPHLRSTVELTSLHLTSLAPYRDLISAYQGQLDVEACNGQIVVSLDLPSD